MKYYAIVVDYNGFCAFQYDTLEECRKAADNEYDFPLVCYNVDTAVNIAHMLNVREVNKRLAWSKRA